MDPLQPSQPQPQTQEPAPLPSSSPPPMPGGQKSSNSTVKIVVIVVGVIVGFFILAFIGLIFLILLAAGSREDSKQGSDTASSSVVDRKAPVTAANSKVTASCYTYSVPKGYELDSGSRACSSAVNISGGDSLTLIEVKAITDTENAKQGSEKLAGLLEDSGYKVISSKVIKKGNLTIGEVEFEDSYNLLRTYYYIPDPSPQFTVGGKLISSYSIEAYTYNADLKAYLTTVVDSFALKS